MLKYLFKDWPEIRRQIGDKTVVLFMDYDGTLTSIVKTPDQAVLPPHAKNILQRLSKNDRFRVIIVTGRELQDIQKRVGIEKIIYVGNHGSEVEGPKIRFDSPLPAAHRSVLLKIKKELAEATAGIKGVFIEDKTLSLSFHFRQINRTRASSVKKIFYQVIKPYMARHEVKTQAGKMVLEVRPRVEWDKGRVILWLLARECILLDEDRIFAVYIGDDMTDEDAFKVLRQNGLTIHVGRSKTSDARFYVKDTEDVLIFLEMLSALVI